MAATITVTDLVNGGGVQTVTVSGVGSPGRDVNPVGTWTTSTAYNPRDLVSGASGAGLGSSYVATVAHTSGASTEPGVGASWETVWMLAAARGTAGTANATAYANEASFPPVDEGAMLLAQDTGWPYMDDDSEHRAFPTVDLLPFSNPKDPRFGAVGDGVADDTAAIQAALDSSMFVIIPAGVFIISSELVTGFAGQRIAGCGIPTLGSSGPTTTDGTQLRAATGSGLRSVLRISHGYTRIEAMLLDGNGTADGGLLLHNAGRGHISVGATRCVLGGVVLDTSPSGLSVGNNNSLCLIKPIVTGNDGAGVHTAADQSDNNAIIVVHPTGTLNDGDGLVIKGSGWSVLGGHLEGNLGYGIRCGSSGDSSHTIGVAIHEPWIEANGSGGIIFGKATRCIHWSNPAGLQFVDWANSDVDNLEYQFSTAGANGTMRLTAHAEGAWIEQRWNGLGLGGGTDTDREFRLAGKGLGGIRLGSSSTNALLWQGSGNPNGQRSAPVGSKYYRIDATQRFSEYTKVQGSTSVGWMPVGNEVGAGNGDAAATLTVQGSPNYQRWDTALTADRAVTLSTTEAYNGARFHIRRTGGGAFNLNVGTGPLKALAANQWCEVVYDGSAWRLFAFGSL